ncbi:hypothetical protein [Terasakiella pusilla]|uniref:hypothetical protein n=1 Tax=Terasakiella pusilla TaxID=64973 RepID=UPI003AA7AAE2
MSKQTLFEAAKDAPDGTRFKAGSFEAVKNDGCLRLSSGDRGNVSLGFLQLTYFEVIPAEPKKRDVRVSDVIYDDGVKFPSDKHDECISSFRLIGRLMQWEGAQLGEPGCFLSWSVSDQKWRVHAAVAHNPPTRVTFKTKDQCLAAYKAECPELMEACHDTA